MSPEIIAAIITALLSLLAGGAASTTLVQKLIRELLKIPGPPEKPYTERLAELTASLTKASKEMDSILAELAKVANDRESAVAKLEQDLRGLEAHEEELKEHIEALEKTPLPVAEHFAELLQKGERRSAKRDYLLFGAGVIVTTIIAIVIQVFAR